MEKRNPSRFEREEARIEAALKLRKFSGKRRQNLINEYKKRSQKAFAPQTVRLYRGILKDFVLWLEDNGYSRKPPISAIAVAEYVEQLGGRIRPNTIETRLWAIAEYHRENFVPSPTRDRIVQLALKGVKRTYGSATKQAPALRKREVLDAIAKLGDSAMDLRSKAVLWIASDSWCRSSEIVAFKVKDICVQDDGSSLLFIARSKTDQYGQGAYAYLSPRGTREVHRWIQFAKLKLNDPILTKIEPGSKKTHLDPATLSRIIKRAIGRNDVSAHSTRVGGVHDAFSLGCDLASIMVAGRWRSPEMPARYGRRILATQSAAARVCSAFEETS